MVHFDDFSTVKSCFLLAYSIKGSPAAAFPLLTFKTFVDEATEFSVDMYSRKGTVPNQIERTAFCTAVRTRIYAPYTVALNT